MTAPDAEYVRTHSRVDFADPDLGLAKPASGTDPLQELVDQACSYITLISGRGFDASVPASLEPIMRQAARMRTEQVAMELKADSVETAGDFDMLSGFTAGAYSETRRGLSDANEAKAGMLNPWPALNRLLWMLLGLAPGETNDIVDGMRDYWRYMLGLAPNPPSWQVIEVAWDTGAMVPGLPGPWTSQPTFPYPYYGG